MGFTEKSLIAEVRRRTRGSRNRAVEVGIGDDCAILRLSEIDGVPADTLVTTDFSLEGVHFRREWHSPESIGHRCLARGLSDIAAMGGKPVAAFLSLALPANIREVWVRRFTHGLLALARKHGVTLAGGDTAESKNEILADIVMVGQAPKGKAVLRSGASAGDRIYVTGALGGSAAAVLEMEAHPKRKLNPKQYSRHFFPEPRVALGLYLREHGLASAMIDTSDGLSTDLAHICEESGVGAEIQAGAVPRGSVGKPLRAAALKVALHGGEDYELLFTAPRGQMIPAKLAGVPVTMIGQITKSKKILLVDGHGVARKLEALGWEHFNSC